MFSIEIKKLYWVDNSENNPEDLCLHGDVVVEIGDERYEESCTVSATALYLLKTLQENHIIHSDNQMLPCCGRLIIANTERNMVSVIGCPNGVDWSVLHNEQGVEIITEKGTHVQLSVAKYEEIVFSFTDKIKSYYQQSAPKIIPNTESERSGYIAFWNEWESRRNYKMSEGQFT